MELMGKSRTLVNEQTTPPPTQTTAAKTPTTGGQQVIQKTIKTSGVDEKPKETMIDGVAYTLPGIKDKATLDKFTNSGINLTNPNDMVRVLGSGLNINYNEKNNLATRTALSLKGVLNAHARKGITKPHTTFENLNNFVKGTLKSSLLEELGLDDTKKQNYMKYYTALLDSRIKGLSQN
jgi:hypothetical protein